jgi:hypothetical protein
MKLKALNPDEPRRTLPCVYRSRAEAACAAAEPATEAAPMSTPPSWWSIGPIVACVWRPSRYAARRTSWRVGCSYGEGSYACWCARAATGGRPAQGAS